LTVNLLRILFQLMIAL